MLEQYVFTFNRYLKSRFGGRVARISFDLGIPCPWNRCIFCRHESFLPFGSVPVTQEGWCEKYETVRRFMARRYKAEKFIAYFQSNTSTCGDPAVLGACYRNASSLPGIVGLIISTRPDYVSEEIIRLILDSCAPSVNEIWLEIGLQSADEKSLDLLKRGHSAAQYLDAVKCVENYGQGRIRVAPHLIAGIPGESAADFYKSVLWSLCSPVVGGLKIHHLQVHRDTELEKHYLAAPFHLLSEDEYISLIARMIAIIPPDIVLFRLFTTSPSPYLAYPEWGKTGGEILKKLEHYLKSHSIVQGCEWSMKC